MSLKHKVESLLFSSGNRMHVDEIAKLCRSNPQDVKQSLQELKKHYDELESSLSIHNEGDYWKITVKDRFLPLVRKIVTKTELDKGTLETLAVIAFKYPVLQSDVIKIRTNKAYDHMKNLEEFGYITRQKHGRTRLIKLTQKFFEYFDLPEDKLKESFRDFEGLAKAIEKKEDEIEKEKEQKKKKAQELKEDIKEKTEIDLIGEKGEKEKLEVYQENQSEIIPVKEKLGNLDVVDEEPVKDTEEEIQEKTQDDPEVRDIQEQEQEKDELEKDKKEQKTELDKEVDERVEQILNPGYKPPEDRSDEEDTGQKSQDEEDKKETQGQQEKQGEPKDLLEAESEENKKDDTPS